jgi:predicted enzyme related to lactoylglutathione lyase
MTAQRGYVPPSDKTDAVGVHSLDHFALQVPDLFTAQRFYSGFGLDVREDKNALALKTIGQDQSWGVVTEGANKRLHHISFGCFADDLERLKRRAEANAVRLVDAPTGFASNGFWLYDHAGLLVEVKVAPKTSPDRKMSGIWSSSPAGMAGAPVRAAAPVVHPRRLAHVLSFTTSGRPILEGGASCR